MFGYDPTGIEQTGLQDEPVIYPNPATNHFIIQTNKDAVITLTDLTGRRVFQRSFTAGKTKKMDVSGLVPGIYIYHIRGNDGTTVSGKVVKE